MNAFLSTLLGAFLATFGGIIGSIFTFYLTKKSDLRNDKKAAYFNLLSLCEKVIDIESADKESFLNELTKARAYIMLYGNKDAKREYNKFHHIATEERDNPKYYQLLNSQIVMIASSMKCDLGIANRKEREIVKKLRKEGDSNAD